MKTIKLPLTTNVMNVTLVTYYPMIKEDVKESTLFPS